MKNLFYTISVFVLTTFSSIAQEVAICGFDASGGTTTAGDEFSFVLLRNFAAGEVIYFTEDEYSNAANAFLSGEGHLEYTVPAGGLLENDVVRIRETGNDVFTVQCATGTAVHVAGSGQWSYSGSDELYAYSASNATSPWSSITAIHCFYYGSVIVPTVDQDPSSDWPNTINLRINLGASGSMNTDFMDASRGNTTLATLQNSSNWTQSTSDITLSCTNFTNQLLPVEIVAFEAEEKGEVIYLNWITESELSNDYFEIHRSNNGIDFERIGTVDGKGTSTSTTHYSFIDERPNNGIIYYRLKQVDFNGDFTNSAIISVEYRNDKNEVSVYPNPFDQSLSVQFHSIENNYSLVNLQTIRVYNVFGKLVHSKQVSPNESIITLDLSKLISGTYLLQVTDGQRHIITQRIMKL